MSTKKAAGAAREDITKVGNFLDSAKPFAVNYDHMLQIATAGSRKATRWANKSVQWEKLVRRCRNVYVTDETQSEYMAMSKDEQSSIKDVGGFVGGHLAGGRRKRDAVTLRSVLTLDLDNKARGAWESFKKRCKCEAIIYSTHKHTPESPRLRLVIPLSRDVTPEEYEPIGRRIADLVGIEMFDPTTYEAGRLMYWPSASKDGEFVFERQTGEWLNPDEVLGTYVDWRDISEWPRSEHESDMRSEIRGKMGDPRSKPGVIGAFCRAYTIEEAIETFLSDIYEPTATPGRYTYKNGTTSGGLVCYDGLFAYSNHATDPAGGREWNAFDLVRVHKFGHMDSGEVSDITKAESYKSMTELAARDGRTIELRMDEIDDDFRDMAKAEWRKILTRDKHGNVEPTAKNFELLAANDEKLKGIKYDTFHDKYTVEEGSRFDFGTHEVTDNSLAEISRYLEVAHGIRISCTRVEEKLLSIIARIRAFHPVMDDIESAVWDGRQRVDSLLIDYLGADDTPLTRAMTRKWLAAAVARIYQPGVKFDYVLTLAGPQGTGKSTLLSILGGEFFSDTFSFGFDGKAQCEAVSAAWLLEVAELVGLSKAEVGAAKAFISSPCDRYRPAYGRMMKRRPRQCVFAATTNESHFLRSLTGDRRWWVVDIHGAGEVETWAPRLKAERSQVWAEAKHIYESGEQLFLPAELEREAREAQERHNTLLGSGIAGELLEWLDTPLPSDWDSEKSKNERRAYFAGCLTGRGGGDELTALYPRCKICVREVKNEFPDPEVRAMTAQQIGRILDSLPGWERMKSPVKFSIYGSQRGWQRTEEPDL